MYFYLLLIASYLLGAIPFGKIVGYIKGIDVQKHGSGNIGFANSLRVLGWGPALFVLLGDILKGYIPVYFALHDFSLIRALIIGAIAILGHITSPWLKFKGGKGVATMLGVSLALNLTIAFIAMVVWMVIFLSKRISSISSLIVVILMPILALLFEPKLTIFYLCLVPLIFITHRRNLVSLVKGKEAKII